MVWVSSIIGVLVATVAVLLIWGMLRLRHGARIALLEAGTIEVAAIGPLAEECVETFQSAFDIQLDLHNCDDAVAKLDAAFLDKRRLKDAFARDDNYWYFALPVGAALGELLRLHARHEWRKQPGQAPYMVARLADSESEVWPFEKAIKHAQVGEQGDLMAYVTFAVSLWGNTVEKHGREGEV